MNTAERIACVLVSASVLAVLVAFYSNDHVAGAMLAALLG